MNIKNGFYSFIFVIFLLGKGLNATITQGPLNSVAETGKEVKFECTADAPIAYWVLSKNGVTSGELKIVGPGCSAPHPAFVDHYSVEILDGGKTCNLNVSNITMEQAGVYRCLEGSDDSSSILTVLESSPIITVNSTTSLVENESVVIECSLNHNGSVIPAPTLRPYFYWTNSVGQNTSSSYDSTTNDTAVSQLRVIAGRQNITAYTCHVYLQLIPTANPNYAGNTPAVSSSNSSSAIEVLYPIHVENITSEGRNSSSSCGISTVVCIGTANPAANYSWVDMEEPEKIITTNQSYNYAVNGSTYGCKATNYIRGHPHTDEANYTVQDQYGITPCKISRTTNMNITGETCSERKCGCLLDCNMTIHCHSDAYPEPSYCWKQAGITILENSTTLEDASNGIYICVAQNIIEGMPFEDELSVEVVNCTNCSRPPWWVYPTSEEPTTTIDTLSTTPSSHATIYVVVVIPVYEIGNLISVGFFLAYYSMHTDQNKNENNSSNATSNKKALNNRFPWLEKMLPCMNPSHATAGKKCLGLFLFALITISCGVFIFPILIIMIKKPCCGEDLHESQENSTINLRLDDISGKVSGENRFPPQPSSLPPAPPSSHGGLANRQASSSAGPPRSPPPPNKPTPSGVQLPQRPPPLLRPPAMSQPINRDGAMEYAFLPFAMKTNLAPVQYLDEESHYAVLKRV